MKKKKKKKKFFFSGGRETQVFFLRCFSAPIQPAGPILLDDGETKLNRIRLKIKNKKERKIGGRKQEGILFPSFGLFRNEIYREWHLWASFRIYPQTYKRILSTCARSFSSCLTPRAAAAVGRSRFYQLERL